MRATKTVSLAALLLGLTACGNENPSDEMVATASEALATTNDVTVSHIQRVPTLNWVQNSTNPTVEGWPAAGSNVTWRGHIKNFSSSSRSVGYRWFFDGVEVASGSVTIAANGTGQADLVRTWDFNRHNVQLVVDPTNAIAEQEEANNSLTVVSNAISVGFWVEQAVYDYFLAHQRELTGAASTCWENWAQRQMGRMNTMFQTAIFPGDTPNGVLDRVRIDKIQIVPNGALPLAGGAPTNNPDFNDRTVDLMWGFEADILSGTFYADTTTATDANPFFYEGSLLHELGHARYLVDNYGFNVHAMPPGNPPQRDSIPLTEGGVNIVGTDYLPMVAFDTVYYNHQHGLMDGDHSFMDLYGARALNLIAGRRATQGSWNAPDNFGFFINDLSAQNRITLVDDATGAPLAGASVRIHQSTSNGTFYSKAFSATPAQTLTANASGQILVGRNPFSPGNISAFHENSVMLLRVQHNNKVRYHFMEVADFNLEYWRGHTAQGEVTLRVQFLPGGVANPSSPVLGFENASLWTPTAGTVTNVSSPITEGAAALSWSGIAYAEIQSTALTQAQAPIGNTIKLDLRLPTQQPNPFWLGVAQVFLSVPSKNVNNAIIGSIELTGLPLGTYQTLTFTVPQWVKTALQGQTYSDLRVKVALNVNQGSGAHLLDNFRFLP
jgi:hypothetical protein